MHRAPLSVLVIVAALAACSTHDVSAAAEELLSQDSTLVSRLAAAQTPRQPALPDACSTVPPAARPTAAQTAEAQKLARRGYDAETLGDLQQARSLLHRASELDGTDKSAAYHLGRTTEALGDRTAAVSAYCRILSLAPTATESAEARERVAQLSQPEPSVAASSVGDTAPTHRRAVATAPRRVTRRATPAATRAVASAPVRRSVRIASAPRAPETSAPSAEHVADRTADGGEVVAARDQTSPVDQASTAAEQPSTAARTSTRGPSRAQRAGIGAVAGAIIGAAASRSVKGAVIGAAAGGMLGTVVGGRIAPVGRGIRP